MARYQEFPHSNKKYILIPIGIGLTIFAIIGGVALYLIKGSPSSKYNQAINSYNAGDYKLAAEQFAKLGDYMDCKQRSAESIIKMHYSDAMKAFQSGDYDTAKTEFEAAGQYENAEALAKESVRASHYAKAVALTQSGDLDGAIKEYQTAQYKDYEEKIFDLYVAKGDKALDDKDYDKAIENYTTAGTFKASDEPLLKCYYRMGDDYQSQNNLKDAASYFAKAGDYQDAPDRLKAVYYTLGADALSKNDYDNAAEYLKLAVGYKDAASKGKEVFYNKGVQLQNSKDFKNAAEYFKLAGEFKDSKTRLNESTYNYGIALLNEGSSADAMLVFESLGGYKLSKELLKVSTAEAYVKTNNISEAAAIYKTVSKKTKVSGFNVQGRKSFVMAWNTLYKVSGIHAVATNTVEVKKYFYRGGRRYRQLWYFTGLNPNQGVAIKFAANDDNTFNITGTVTWGRFTKFAYVQSNVRSEIHTSNFQFAHVKKYPSVIKLSGGAKLKYKNGLFTVTYSKYKGGAKYYSHITYR